MPFNSGTQCTVLSAAIEWHHTALTTAFRKLDTVRKVFHRKAALEASCDRQVISSLHGAVRQAAATRLSTAIIPAMHTAIDTSISCHSSVVHVMLDGCAKHDRLTSDDDDAVL